MLDYLTYKYLKRKADMMHTTKPIVEFKKKSKN